MKASKRTKLEAAGWKVGSASEFLELSDAEEMLVTMKLALATNVKAMRQQKRMTQQELAKKIGSSQSRVAKMEIADSSVSMEFFFPFAGGTRSIAYANWQHRRYAGCDVETGKKQQKATRENVNRSANG